MRGIIRYYVKGKNGPIIKYVKGLKYLGLINEAADCPIEPDWIDKVVIYADFNAPSEKEEKK